MSDSVSHCHNDKIHMERLFWGGIETVVVSTDIVTTVSLSSSEDEEVASLLPLPF